MKEACSCGFILAEVKNGYPTGWLLCHPTNGGNRWDFPKGKAEPGEDHLVAAKRELHEETGLELVDDFGVVDLGQHAYDNKKDLHLFYVEVANIDTRVMHCESMVENPKGPNFPEMDAFAVFEMHKLGEKVGNKLDDWIMAHIPVELRLGYEPKV